MEPKPNETPLLTKILRRLKVQCNKNKQYTKNALPTSPDTAAEGQNKIEHVIEDNLNSQAGGPCGCHCVASCHQSLNGKPPSDTNTLVHSRFPVSKSCVEHQISSPSTFRPNSLVLPEGYSSLCELFDQFHTSSHCTPTTPTKPFKRDSQMQTDPLPNLPPLFFPEQILHMNNNTSLAQNPNRIHSHMAAKHSPIPTETTHQQSFDQISSSGYSTCSFDRKTRASRTLSDPSLQKDVFLSPGIGNLRFDYSQPSEYQHNKAIPDSKHWDQESSPTSTAFVGRSARTQSQSTPTHENSYDDFLPPHHRRRSLSDSYAIEVFRVAKRVEKLRKTRRNGSSGRNVGISLGLICPYREEKLTNMHLYEDKLSKKTAFSTFLDKMPKLSLLKRFKEKPLQYESVPDLSKCEHLRTPRKLKGNCRNVRSHEQLDQAGMRNRRACSLSSSKLQRSASEYSQCIYIDPDTVSRNFSKNNALNLTKSVRKTMSNNSIDTKARNVSGGSADTTPFHQRSVHSAAPRSCNLADVGVYPDSDEFYMTFDPDLNPPCPSPAAMMSSASYETLLTNWRPIRGRECITTDNCDQNHTPTPNCRPSTISPRHLCKQRCMNSRDNRKYMPLPPLPTEITNHDIYQEIPGDAVFTSPSHEDMHHGVHPQSKSRFSPFTHSSSSSPSSLTSPSRSPGRGNIFFSEGFFGNKLPVVSENGMRKRPDYLSVHPSDMSDLTEDRVSTGEMGARSPTHISHRTLSFSNRQSKYKGYHSSSALGESCGVREEVPRGKIKIPPIFLQQ